MTTMLDGALNLLHFGWSVFPVEPRGKHPLVSWAALQGASAEEETVREWWRRWPWANVGVVTGAFSDIVALDVDGPQGVESVRSAGLQLPRTVSSRTGRGWHLYFRHPGWQVTTRSGILPGVDIRGDGGCVLAPPSVHSTGRVYAWSKGRGPREFPLAELPPRLADFLKSATAPPCAAAGGGAFLEGVTEGRRNERAASLAGRFIARGFTPGETREILRLWNAKNEPPMADEELSAVVNSIAKRHASRVTE